MMSIFWKYFSLITALSLSDLVHSSDPSYSSGDYHSNDVEKADKVTFNILIKNGTTIETKRIITK